MPPLPTRAAALRELLAARFPAAVHARGTALATGIPAVDQAAGGLPRPGLTELVCPGPSCGSQLFLGQLLHTTRQDGLRVALVERTDAFDPDSWPPSLLEHLVWVRARHSAEALHATDLLARDANLGLVLLDLRDAPLAELRRLPAPAWYRLQRAVEPTSLATLILTPRALVPSTHLRLELRHPFPFTALHEVRPALGAALAPDLLRQRQLQSAAG